MIQTAPQMRVLLAPDPVDFRKGIDGLCRVCRTVFQADPFAGERPIGCFAFSSAAFGMNVRDVFIGWSAEQRSRNRHLLAYNTRFLILPWVRIKFLASHLLAACTRRLSDDWQQLYYHPIHWVETFVDTERFQGACYKAANWIYLGQTKGRGKYNKTHKQLTSVKAIYGLPLDSAFRTKLCQ